VRLPFGVSMGFSRAVGFPPEKVVAYSCVNSEYAGRLQRECDGRGLTTKFAKIVFGGAVTTSIGGVANPSTANPPAVVVPRNGLRPVMDGGRILVVVLGTNQAICSINAAPSAWGSTACFAASAIVHNRLRSLSHLWYFVGRDLTRSCGGGIGTGWRDWLRWR
jgi:hypothetical protein